MITTVTLNASIDKAYEMNATIQNGTVMRVGVCRNTAGGKGLNVARVVRQCGSEVMATGLVGGFNGAYLEALLKQDSIKNQFAHVKGETRSCINILDNTYGSTEYLEPGCEVTAEECQNFLENVFPNAIAGSSVVTISGSVPKGVGPDIYEKMVQIVKEQEKLVILDTSGELLKQGMKAMPTMVKPNQDELEMLFGSKIEGTLDVISHAKKIHETGIPYVVVSLGKDGAIMVCKEGIYQAIPPKMEVVNTVGCGDSMVGAFAVALENQFPSRTALKYAVAVATANALSPKTGDFNPDVSRELLERIELRELYPQDIL